LSPRSVIGQDVEEVVRKKEVLPILTKSSTYCPITRNIGAIKTREETP
jgi:hypothetical protein